MAKLTLSCSCGNVVFEAQTPNIVSVECCCESCRTASKIFDTRAGAPKTLEDNGTTRYELYRKDRVRCLRGAEHLREHRLQAQSPTRRVIAICCHAPMFLEFTHGHWLSLYGRRFAAGTLPPLEMRTMAKDLPEGATLAADVPNPKTHTWLFYRRLLGAWIAMGFRVPKITYVVGTLDG